MRSRSQCTLTGIMMTVTLLIFLLGGAKDGYTGENAAKAIEIEYGYPDQSIFVATVNSKGQPDSPMTLVAGELMRQAGLPWHATPYPAKRLFDNLKRGTTAFSILVRASSLQDSCIFSRDPIYSTHLNLYHIGDKPRITSKEQLAGKHIITIRGYSYAGLLQFILDPVNHIKNEVAGTHRAAFKMLSHNRGDYLLDYASAGEDILSQRPIADIRSTSLAQLDVFLVLSKSYPGAETLMIRLENIAATLNIQAILKQKQN